MILLSLLFIITYWNNILPPTNDLISPFVLLSIASYGNNYYLIIAVLIDTFADYVMNSKDLRFPIFLFSVGHIVKQIPFLIFFNNLLIFYFSLLLLLILIYHIRTMKYIHSDIVTMLAYYAAILVLTVVQIQNIGYIFFIISDLLILIDMIGNVPRKLRVLGVPILFWIAEYLIVTI